MERAERKAERPSPRARLGWIASALIGVWACGGASHDELLAPVGSGGQGGAMQGGTGGIATSTGGESPGGTEAGAAGQASSGGEPNVGGAGGMGSGGVASGGSASGGTESGGSASGGASGKATGGVGGKATGGTGGKATGGTGGTSGSSAGGQGGSSGARTGGAGGGAGRGGAAGASGSGAGGAAATCPGKCDANADCSVATGAVVCTCKSGFVGNGTSCARPISCNELHQASPSLASGMYTLRPAAANAAFSAYCEMAAEGGGWTLVLNDGPSFDPATQGVADAQCYRSNCTSLAYSTVLVGSDVMLDLRDGALVATNQVARVVISGVEARTRGKTVRALFTTGPYYLEKQDNSNLSVRLGSDGTCNELLAGDIGALVCNTCAAGTSCAAPVLTFGDADPGCVDDATFAFAVGGSESYTVPWGNCAGWPQQPNPSNVNHYPDNFRVWVR